MKKMFWFTVPKKYQYQTTCLTCGWHKDCGASFSEIHKHIDECPSSRAVVVLSIREKE